MEERAIIQDAQKNLSSFQMKNYDELKSAIESKKLVKEIQNMPTNRWVAFVSAVTALLSVAFLIWQSGITRSFGQKEVLKMRIENLEDEKEKIESEIAGLESVKSEKINESQAKEQIVADINGIIQERNSRIEELNRDISALEANKTSIRNKIDRMKKTPIEPTGETIGDTYQKVLAANLELTDQYNQMSASLASEQRNLVQLKTNVTELESRNSDLAREKSTLNDDIARLRNFRDNLNRKLSSIGVGEIVSASLKRDELAKLGNYTITLANVGNIKNNLDIRVQIEGEKSKYFANLDQGTRYLIRYDNKVFAIHVIEASKAPNKSDEAGKLEIGMINYNYSFLY